MDARTIESARRGSRAARERLLGELQDSWYRLCLSLLRDAELAREATQETALRFLHRLPAFRGESALRTWSMGIAVNVVREIRRKVSGAGIADTVAESSAPGPEAAAELAEQRALLHATLAGLPHRQREVIVLRFLEELSVEETARVMGCAPGTVKAATHQALRTLRQKLKQLT